MADLPRLLQEHMKDPFPLSVEKGETYGQVDSVLIGADIVGWASTVASGGVLNPPDRKALLQARDELQTSLDAFSAEARSYYEKLVLIASAALEYKR